MIYATDRHIHGEQQAAISAMLIKMTTLVHDSDLNKGDFLFNLSCDSRRGTLPPSGLVHEFFAEKPTPTCNVAVVSLLPSQALTIIKQSQLRRNAQRHDSAKQGPGRFNFHVGNKSDKRLSGFTLTNENCPEQDDLLTSELPPRTTTSLSSWTYLFSVHLRTTVDHGRHSRTECFAFVRAHLHEPPRGHHHFGSAQAEGIFCKTHDGLLSTCVFFQQKKN